MLRKLGTALMVFLLALCVSGCWLQEALNPTFSTDFSIVINSTAERSQLTQINGATQSYILSPPPGSLSHDYVVEIEVKDLDYYDRYGNQSRPFQAYVTVSLFDQDTGVQSRAKEKTVYSDRVNVFNFTESDFR